jgi:hypothetical protein
VSAVGCMPLLDCVIFSAPPAARCVMGDIQPAHAPRHRPAPRLCRPSWPVTLEAECLATCRRPAFFQQYSLARPSNLTLGITRRPEPQMEFDKRRVGGRVHAVVRRLL